MAPKKPACRQRLEMAMVPSLYLALQKMPAVTLSDPTPTKSGAAKSTDESNFLIDLSHEDHAKITVKSSTNAGGYLIREFIHHGTSVSIKVIFN
jgi:hypothetical protein